MGKEFVERSVRFRFDDTGGTPRELCADLLPGTLSGLGTNTEDIDMTGACDDFVQAVAGIADGEVTAQFHMDDTAVAAVPAQSGAYTVLPPMVRNSGTMTVQFGKNGAAPTTGDPQWEGEYTLMQANVNITGGRAILDCRWRLAPNSAAPAWGTVA